MRNLPPLASLRAFEAAARHLSFKAAAGELGVTPTAISHQIRSLEEACGRPLFRRRPRPLALTEAGERLFPAIRDGLDAFAGAVATVAAAPGRRPLRVTSPNAFASRWLIPRIPRWQNDHPEIALEVIGTDAVLDLHGNEVDLAVRYARSAPEACLSEEILRDRFFPVCRPGLLKDGRGARRASELLRHPLIHFDWMRNDEQTPTWRRWFAAARAAEPGLSEPPAAWDLSFREELHAIEAVLAGQGIAILSDAIVGRELADGTLVKAHPLSLPGYAYYVVSLRDHPRRTTIRAFAEWMRTVA